MAADGEEALRALEEETFDLAILDMHMPERSGTEVIKLYRFMELGQAPMPFVLLTANVTSDAVREAEDAGVAAYLTKPVEARRLLETLERVLLAEQAAGEDLAPEGDEPATERRGAGHDPRSTPDGYLVSGQTMKELARMSQDPAFLSNLIQGFLRDSEKLLGAMETAAEECRLEDLRGNAHTLKGSAANLGVEAVANVCGRLQNASATDLASGHLRHELEALQDLLKRARPALLVHASGQLHR